jgi:hypothetical protein
MESRRTLCAFGRAARELPAWVLEARLGASRCGGRDRIADTYGVHVSWKRATLHNGSIQFLGNVSFSEKGHV